MVINKVRLATMEYGRSILTVHVFMCACTIPELLDSGCIRSAAGRSLHSMERRWPAIRAVARARTARTAERRLLVELFPLSAAARLRRLVRIRLESRLWGRGPIRVLQEGPTSMWTKQGKRTWPPEHARIPLAALHHRPATCGQHRSISAPRCGNAKMDVSIHRGDMPQATRFHLPRCALGRLTSPSVSETMCVSTRYPNSDRELAMKTPHAGKLSTHHGRYHGHVVSYHRPVRRGRSFQTRPNGKSRPMSCTRSAPEKMNFRHDISHLA